MRRYPVLIATTALVTLAGAWPAFADVSVTGDVGFTYDTADDGKMDPDYNIWVKADQVNDKNTRYGGAVRLTPGNDGDASSSRHYLYVENEMGKLILGQHHGPGYTMSLGADWRGTVSAPGKSSYNAIQGHTTPRVIYQTPNVGGFQLGTSVSSGSETLGAETQLGVNYSIPFGDSKIRLGHSRHKVGAVGMQTSDAKADETGIEFNHGKWTVSFLKFNRKEADGFITNEFHPTNLDLAFWCMRKPYVTWGGDPEGTRIVHSVSECDFPENGVLENINNDELGNIDSVDLSSTPLYFSPLDYSRKYPHNSESKNGHVFTYDTFNTGAETSGQEMEIAYTVNDQMVMNLVKYSENDYDRLTIGTSVTIAPNLNVSMSQSSIDNNGTSESATRIKAKYIF